MKKTILVAGLAGVLLLTGGGLVYQTYAAEGSVTNDIPVVQSENVAQDEISSVNVPQLEEKVAVDPSVQQIGVDPSQVPAGELLIPENINQSSAAVSIQSTQNSSEISGLEQTSLNATNQEDGYHFQATYQSQNGTEYLVLQAPIESDINTTIQDIKGFYKETVEETEINGQPAAYVDGQQRKVVHFFVNDRGLTVSTYNGSLDDVITVAEQIAQQQ